MTNDSSSVLQFGCPEPFETAAEMALKLRFHTDSWDLAEALNAGHPAIAVIDARSRDAYLAAHIPGATSFSHREMNAGSVARLDRDKIYIVYCDGIGCNASTKGAFKLAGFGFRTKELLGGLDWWRRDGHPVQAGADPGNIREPQKTLVGISGT